MRAFLSFAVRELHLTAIRNAGLKDLVDDEPKEIRIPVISSKNLGNLRQIHIDSQAEKTHEYRIIGYLTTTVLLTAGLDEDHETHADRSQAARHEFEAYDRIVSSRSPSVGGGAER